MLRVGVGVVVEKDNRVLLLHRKNVHGEGTWSTPGGHMEFGETPESCATREVLEETGARIGKIHFIGITNDVFDDTRHYITIWMRAEYLSGKVYLAAEYESDEIGWFAWDTLPEPLFLPLKHLLAGQTYPPDIFFT